jgi:hypothetical protein
MNKWLKSCLIAGVAGIATAVGSDLLDPQDFNWRTGLSHLLEVAVGGAISTVGLYLTLSYKREKEDSEREERMGHFPFAMPEHRRKRLPHRPRKRP